MTGFQFKKAALNLAKLGIGLSGILLVLIVRGCVVRPATSYSGNYFNHGKNASWLGVEWLNELHSDAEVSALATDLTQHQIAYIFVYTSYLKADYTFNPTYSHATEFLRSLRSAQPHIKVLAWIGIPLTYIDLSSAAVRQQIADFSGSLVMQYGFDGVHLDPEPVGNQNANLLLLFDRTRQAIGKQALLSLAAHTAWPIFADSPLLDATNTNFWGAAYFRAVAQYVDQIAVMTYDSTLTSPLFYRLWSRFQVIAISKAVGGTGVELLLGIPTSEEETATHHVNAENMQSGLTGIIDGLNDEESRPAAVTGIAIYPYWEIDTTKWALYDQLWLK